MLLADEYTETIARDGFTVVESVVPDDVIDALLPALADVGHEGAVERRGSVHAVRNLLEAVPQVRALARMPSVRALAEPVLGPECFVVRAILFDKTPQANWKVAWHQDLTIAVRAPADAPGFGPWSEKAGIPHVQPPVEVLERMLTVRVHLDPCGLENGPVQVLPGSHAHGRLSPDAADRLRAEGEPVACTSGRGGALVMRPAILHASPPRPGRGTVAWCTWSSPPTTCRTAWSGTAGGDRDRGPMTCAVTQVCLLCPLPFCAKTQSTRKRIACGMRWVREVRRSSTS